MNWPFSFWVGPPILNHLPLEDDIFRCIFVNEKFCILIKTSMKFVPTGPIDNNPALVQIMAWHRIGDKLLFEPMLTRFTDAALGGGGWGWVREVECPSRDVYIEVYKWWVCVHAIVINITFISLTLGDAYICVSKSIIIGSDSGLSPGRRQAIIWTNAGILLIRILETNFNEIKQNSYIFIQENAFENVVCEVATIFVSCSMS